MRFIIIALALVLVGSAMAGKINHILVLMEENRSFDHILGDFRGTKRGTRGRSLNNSVTLKNGTRVVVPYTTTAPFINYCDPNHGLPPTTYKIFGTANPAPADTESMSGFAQFEYDNTAQDELALDECNVMQGLASSQVPVLTALAEEFVLFDNFFASLPGPTWPNRLFFMAGTSEGLTETGPWYKNEVGQLFPLRTIFDQVEEAGGTWAVYYDDSPWELFVETLAHHPENMRDMKRFYADAAAGTLPTFAFMNPRAGVNLTTGAGSNDQHPDHDVRLGEHLYRDVYHAVRASPKWNETLFVVTYDEHGGFFDHVAPPRPVPPPKSGGMRSYPDEFDFGRGGLRIPTILISPWVPKGLVVTHPPAAQQPHPTSVYELTSIISSSRKLLDVLNATPALTQRDAWAATFEHLFDVLSEPRTDCPVELPMPAPFADEGERRRLLEQEARMSINPLQERIMAVHANLVMEPYPSHITQQGHVEGFTRPRLEEHHRRTASWRRSKEQHASGRRLGEGPPVVNRSFVVLIMPGQNAALNEGVWGMHRRLPQSDSSAEEHDRWIAYLNISGVAYCLDAAGARAGAIVGVSECYPTPDPAYNRDRDQWWHVFDEYTLRPARNSTLCVTTTMLGPQGGNQLELQPCVADHEGSNDDAAAAVFQRFSWVPATENVAWQPKDGGDGLNFAFSTWPVAVIDAA